jgi:hypothetical protein
MNLIRCTRGVLRTAGVWAAAWSVPGFVWMSIFAYRSSFDRFDLLGFASASAAASLHLARRESLPLITDRLGT